MRRVSWCCCVPKSKTQGTKIFANASSVADVAYVDFVDESGAVVAHAGAVPPVMASLPSRGHALHQDDHHVILQDVMTRGAQQGALRVAMTREGFTQTKENFRTAIILCSPSKICCSTVNAG